MLAKKTDILDNSTYLYSTYACAHTTCCNRAGGNMAIVPTAVGGSTYFLLKDMQFTISAGSLPYSLLANKKYNFFAAFFCFFSLVACSFKEKEKKPRKFQFAWILFLFKMLFLHFRYSVYSFVRVFVESPIYLIIGQGAVNTSTHDQPTILQDFLPCFLLALCNHIEYAVKNIFGID